MILSSTITASSCLCCRKYVSFESSVAVKVNGDTLSDEHMWARCRYTRRRPDRTHGGVLNLHTEGAFRVPCYTTHTRTTTPHAHTDTTHTTHNTTCTHTTPTPHTTHTHTTPHTTQHSTTDHDLANVIFNKSCNICNVCNFHEDVLFFELI